MKRQGFLNTLKTMVAALMVVLIKAASALITVLGLVVLAVDVYAIYIDAMEFLEIYHATFRSKPDDNSLI